jgi:DNA polymerase III epsilon subunit-like protein
MKNKKFLVVDTETGGLDCDNHSILSIAGVFWEPRKEVHKLFDFYVKEESISYVDKALEINKIDLNKVEQEGLTPLETVYAIRYLLDHKLGIDRSPIQLIAHNAPFDLGFIKRLYRLANKNFHKDFKDRAIDTCSILQFMQISGKATGDRASADVLFENAGVKILDSERHTAIGDALATAKSLDVILDKL